MFNNTWIRYSKPNKYDKIPLSLFKFNLEEHQKFCNGAWYYYDNAWYPTVWIIDNNLKTFIQYDIYGNEISRCMYCINGYCSNYNHNEYWKELYNTDITYYKNQIEILQSLNLKLYREIDRLNYINKQHIDEINDLKKENINNIPDIISSVIKNAID